MEKIRRTKVVIKWAGKDVSADLAPYLRELTFIDTAEKGAKDELQISLFNKDSRFFDSWYPTSGDILEASLIYFDGIWHSFPLGKFTLDRLDFKFSPQIINIRALSFISIKRDVLKQKRSKAWENISLKDVVLKIANMSGLKPIVKCPDVFFPRIDIRQESFEQILKRLAKEYNCKFNIKGENLIFSNDLYPMSYTINLKANDDIEDGSLIVKIRDQVKAVKMDYYDPKLKKTITYTAGDASAIGDTVKKIYGIARSEKEAREKCEKELKRINSETIEGDLTIIGRPISAGTTITISGIGKLSGEYQVLRAVHTVSPSSGWSVRLSIKGGKN